MTSHDEASDPQSPAAADPAKNVHSAVVKKVIEEGFEIQVAVRLTGEHAEECVKDLEILGVQIINPFMTCAGTGGEPIRDALF